MKTVLVTGAKGFIGKNLAASLAREKDIAVLTFDVDDAPELLPAHLRQADFVFHLAGVNRPEDPADFRTGNADSTATVVRHLAQTGKKIPVLLTSSIQAERDNLYGASKKAAEDILIDYRKRTGAPVYIYRLPGVFGKWSRPNYNTVVATFCHNIARGLEIRISDPDAEIELVYIDDVVRHFLSCLSTPSDDRNIYYSIDRTFRVKLGDLADRVRAIHAVRTSLTVPDLSDEFTTCLYATYLSFLPEDGFSHPVKLVRDDRGWLFELIKSRHFGQVFVSRTLPGVARGNHYHDTKFEKFCVISGRGLIRFRRIDSDAILDYPVDENSMQIVDIPPGYTHSIRNTGDREMICLFWANQIFDPDRPDTHFMEV